LSYLKVAALPGGKEELVSLRERKGAIGQEYKKRTSRSRRFPYHAGPVNRSDREKRTLTWKADARTRTVSKIRRSVAIRLTSGAQTEERKHSVSTFRWGVFCKPKEGGMKSKDGGWGKKKREKNLYEGDVRRRMIP